jgi:hypothetical protein
MCIGSSFSPSCLVIAFKRALQLKAFVVEADASQCFVPLVAHTPVLWLSSSLLHLLCRLFAVGYAARQISCRSQLELLISNNAAVASGLAIHPADWLSVGPEDVTCAQCSREVQRSQVRTSMGTLGSSGGLSLVLCVRGACLFRFVEGGY